MNIIQQQHANQALKDIFDAAKRLKPMADEKTAIWLGELMAKVSTSLAFDFDEEYPNSAN